MESIKAAVSYVLGTLLLLMGLMPLLGQWHIITFDILAWLPADAETIIVMASALWLAIDGFGEEHLFKYASLILSLILGLIIALPYMSNAGWLPFALPLFIIAIANYLFIAGGVLLIFGPFMYN